MSDGVVQWYRHGKFHREDGPAETLPDGTQRWYRHGELHRLDGPAATGPRGEYWFRNGKRHREDGPAIIDADGTKSWYLDGNRLTEEEFKALRTKELDAIADAFRTGLDHEITVSRPFKKR
jgi:hypothetical protein